MCGNGIRCVGKYVYDYGLTDKKEISVETLAGIKYLKLQTKDNKVSKVCVNMGEPIFAPDRIPVLAEREPVVKEPIHVRAAVGNDLHIHGQSPCGDFSEYSGERISFGTDRAVF